MRNESSVKLFYDQYRGMFDLYIFRYFPGGRQYLRNEGKGVVTWVDIKEGKAVERDPLLSLDSYAAEKLATALAERGIKPKQASFTEGKLEATDAHLKDLRKLLKL